MERALQEFRIRGVKTNIPFLLNVVTHPTFLAGRVHHAVHRRDARSCSGSRMRQDRATQAAHLRRRGHGQRLPRREADPPVHAPARAGAARAYNHVEQIADGSRQRFQAMGAEAFSRWVREQTAAAGHRHHLPRRPPVAAGHAAAHPRHAPRRRRLRPPAAQPVLDRDVGRRDVRHRHAVPQGRPVGAAGPAPRARSPTSSSRCCSAARTPSATRAIPTTSSRSSSRTAAAAGIDLFRVFDSLNWVPNMARRDRGRARGRRALRGGHLLHRRHPRPGPAQVRPEVLRRRWPGSWRSGART